MIVLRLAALAALIAAAGGCTPDRPDYDLLIRGGRVYDGVNEVGRADVGITGERVAAVGDLAGRTAARTIDATGLTVAPGFIDVQGQSGVTLLADGNAESHLRQGITSEVIGEGSSPAFWTAETADAEALRPWGLSFDWTGFDGYFRTLQQRGIAINLGTLVPATMVRRQIIGLENREPTADELSRMEAMVEQGMRDGALGLSSALIYPPGSFAKTPELIALARAASRHDGIYVTHVRGESFNLFNALDEALTIGREATIPVVIFHLKVAARANWGRMGEAIAKLEAANRAGQTVQATMYPYTAGGTGLAATLPLWVQEGGREQMVERLRDPAVRARVRREIETTMDGWENLLMAAGFDGIQIASVPPTSDQGLVGRRLSEIAALVGRDPWQTLFDLLVETEGRVGAIYHMMSEEDVRHGLGWGAVSIGTDSAAIRTEGLLARGAPHPRAYGTFPRLLGKYVREDKVMSLNEAIKRSTSHAAQQFGIPNRGILRTGAFADVVIFDAATIADTATYEKPHQYPVGILHVIVNGVPVLDPNGLTGARPGRPIYHRNKTS